jgi:hypothetical protein
MFLRNRIKNNLIKTSKYYKNTIEYPEYIQPWAIIPAFKYIDGKQGRQLEEKSLTYNPIYAGKRVDNIYNYKTNEPLDDSTSLNAFNRPFGSLRLQRFPSVNFNRGISRIERFNNNNNNNLFTIISLMIIVCLVILLTNRIKIV